MRRINIEILLRKIKRKENVYIAEIQESDGDYVVLTYEGPVKDTELKRLVHITTEDPDRAEAVMSELLIQKIAEGFLPIPNGSDIDIPGFKNTAYTQTAPAVDNDDMYEHRRLSL